VRGGESSRPTPTVIPERVATYQKNRAIAYEQMDKLGVKYVTDLSGTSSMMSVPGMTGAQVGTGIAGEEDLRRGCYPVGRNGRNTSA